MKDTCLSVLTIRGNTNNKIWGFFFKKKQHRKSESIKAKRNTKYVVKDSRAKAAY